MTRAVRTPPLVRAVASLCSLAVVAVVVPLVLAVREAMGASRGKHDPGNGTGAAFYLNEGADGSRGDGGSGGGGGGDGGGGGA